MRSEDQQKVAKSLEVYRMGRFLTGSKPVEDRIPLGVTSSLKNQNCQANKQVEYRNTNRNCLTKKLHINEDTYYVSKLIRNLGVGESEIMKHFTSSFWALKEKRQASDVKDVKQIYLPKDPKYKNKKTLLFDLDETLIHSTKSQHAICDVRIPMTFPNGQVINAGINIRPFALEVLETLSRHFQIMVFTASHSFYADPILNMLDPGNKVFSHRLYREHCTQIMRNTFVKDLRTIPRDLSEMVIIDNSPISYVFQLDNAIPIVSYYQGSDIQLRQLQSYLLQLIHLPDVRQLNSTTFRLSQYDSFETHDQVAKELYQQ